MAIGDYDASGVFDVEVTENINELVFTDSELAADFTEYVEHDYDMQMLCKVNFNNLFDGIPIPAHQITADKSSLTAAYWYVADPLDDVQGVDIDDNYKPFARRLRNVLVNGDAVHTRGYYEVYEDEKDLFVKHSDLQEEQNDAQLAYDKAVGKQVDFFPTVADTSGAYDAAVARKNEATKKLTSLNEGTDEYKLVELEIGADYIFELTSEPSAGDFVVGHDVSGNVSGASGEIVFRHGKTVGINLKVMSEEEELFLNDGLKDITTNANPSIPATSSVLLPGTGRTRDVNEAMAETLGAILLNMTNVAEVTVKLATLNNKKNDASGHIIRVTDTSTKNSAEILKELTENYLSRAMKPDNLDYVSATTQPKLTVDPSGEVFYWSQTRSVEEIIRSAIQATNPQKYQAAANKLYDSSDDNPRLLPSTDISREYLIREDVEDPLRVQADIKMENLDKVKSFMQRPKTRDGASNATVWNGAFFTEVQAGEIIHKLWEFETESRRVYREHVQKNSPDNKQPEDILQSHSASSGPNHPGYLPRMEFVAHSPQHDKHYTKFDPANDDAATTYAGGYVPVDFDSVKNPEDLIRYGKFTSNFQLGDKISSVLDLKIMHGDRTGDTNNTVVNVDTYRVKVTLEHCVKIDEGLWQYDASGNGVGKPCLKDIGTQYCYPVNAESRDAGVIGVDPGTHVFQKYGDSRMLTAGKVGTGTEGQALVV